MLRLCLVGGREKWKEGVVVYLGEGDEEGVSYTFFHDVWYDNNEKKAKIIFLVWYRNTRERKEYILFAKWRYYLLPMT